MNLEGGKIQYGWALWQPAGFFLAAEHHAVYEPQAGPPWVDITPHNSDAIRILFLPDENAVYKVSSNQRRDNERLSLVDDERVPEFFRLWSQLVAGVEEQRFFKIERRWNLLKIELDQAYPLPKLGQNDPCLCGSPKKYKDCHGQR